MPSGMSAPISEGPPPYPNQPPAQSVWAVSKAKYGWKRFSADFTSNNWKKPTIETDAAGLATHGDLPSLTAKSRKKKSDLKNQPEGENLEYLTISNLYFFEIANRFL